MRHLDVTSGSQNQADIAKRAFAEEKHAKSRCDNVYRISHALEIMFAKQL